MSKGHIPDYFDEWYGKEKPRKVSTNLPVSADALTAVGYIALQWAALGQTLEFQVKFRGTMPQVPLEIRSLKVRRETIHQLERLGLIAPYLWDAKRDNALSEYLSILSSIASLKGDRDRLLHGTYALSDNLTPTSITVHYKNKKSTFTVERLRKIGHAIGQANAGLMEFDQWADYHHTRTLLEQLPEPNPQP